MEGICTIKGQSTSEGMGVRRRGAWELGFITSQTTYGGGIAKLSSPLQAVLDPYKPAMETGSQKPKGSHHASVSPSCHRVLTFLFEGAS